MSLSFLAAVTARALDAYAAPSASRHCRPAELTLTPEECAALESIVASMGTVSEPCHFMISGRGVKEQEEAEVPAAVQILRRAALRIGAHGVVVSVRVLFSPPNAPPQAFHLDYAKELRSIDTFFVAVTPSTCENCTEILQFASDETETSVREHALASRVPLEPHEWQLPSAAALRVVPILMRRWDSVVLRTTSAFHRRSANRSGFLRVTFNVDVAVDDAAGAADGFVCVDTQRSLATGRVCPHSAVDELGEQDVFLRGCIEQHVGQGAGGSCCKRHMGAPPPTVSAY
jgi:hypothetical protein